MPPHRQLSWPMVSMGEPGSAADTNHASRGAGEPREAANESNTYFHRMVYLLEIDRAWLEAATSYEQAMGLLVLRQPGAIERVRAAAQVLQALQALTYAQASLGPDDVLF
jgi:hypothetical protein